jgi:hypothetical protein
MRRTIKVSTSWCLAASLLLAAAQTASADDAQEAELRKQAEAAKAQQTAAQKVSDGVRQKAKGLTDTLSKLKADVAKAQATLKAATAKLKTQQDAATKAAAAKTAQDAANAAAAKLAKDADAAAKAALAKSQAAAAAAKAAQVKAVAAAKALTDSQAAVKTTQTDMATAKKTVDGAPAATKQAEAQIAAFQVEVKKAEDQLAVATAAAIGKQKGLEHVLTEAGKFVSFSDTIAPIFAKRCLACHNARTAKGRLNLETYAALMKGGENGAVVDPGEGDLSSLFAMVEDGSMPEDADPLTKEQMASIKKWIDTGAQLNAGAGPNAQLITIMPKLPQPLPPEAYRVPIPVTALQFSPDGTQLASSGYHEIVLWNPADGQIIRRITNVAERVYDIEYSADGKTIAIAAGTPAQMGEVKLFNAADGALLADLVTSGDSVFSVAFSPDGKRLACAGADRSIRIIDIASRKEEMIIEDHADWVIAIAWSPDGAKLASASRDKTSKVFDAKTGDSLVTFNGHGQPVFGVGFSPDGKQVVTCGRDKQIRTWNIGDAKQVRAIGGFGDEVFRITVTKEGQVYSASADKTARSHNVADGKALKTFTGHSDWVYSVAPHTASKRVATGSYDGEIRIWNLDDAKTTANFVAAPGYKAPEASASK